MPTLQSVVGNMGEPIEYDSEATGEAEESIRGFDPVSAENSGAEP